MTNKIIENINYEVSKLKGLVVFFLIISLLLISVYYYVETSKIEAIYALQNTEVHLPSLIAERHAEVHNYSNFESCYDLNISSPVFLPDDYDCEAYSRDLNIIYEILGYESYVFKNYDKKHSYLLIPLEPQSGRLWKTVTP